MLKNLLLALAVSSTLSPALAQSFDTSSFQSGPQGLDSNGVPLAQNAGQGAEEATAGGASSGAGGATAGGAAAGGGGGGTFSDAAVGMQGSAWNNSATPGLLDQQYGQGQQVTGKQNGSGVGGNTGQVGTLQLAPAGTKGLAPVFGY